MNKTDKMKFVKDTHEASGVFFHYLAGWFRGEHLDEMVEAAKSFREVHPDVNFDLDDDRWVGRPFGENSQNTSAQ